MDDLTAPAVEPQSDDDDPILTGLLRTSAPAPSPKSLSQDEVADVLRTAGWDEKYIPTMSAIGMAESALDEQGRARVDSYNPGVGHGGRPTKERSHGLFQINMIDPQRQRKYNAERLRSDPVYNAQVALELFNERQAQGRNGLTHWGAYTDGRYKKFLGSAPSEDPILGGLLNGGAPPTVPAMPEIEPQKPLYDPNRLKSGASIPAPVAAPPAVEAPTPDIAPWSPNKPRDPSLPPAPRSTPFDNIAPAPPTDPNAVDMPQDAAIPADAKAFHDANAYLASQGKKLLSREEFDAEVAKPGGTAQATTLQLRPEIGGVAQKPVAPVASVPRLTKKKAPATTQTQALGRVSTDPDDVPVFDKDVSIAGVTGDKRDHAIRLALKSLGVPADKVETGLAKLKSMGRGPRGGPINDKLAHVIITKGNLRDFMADAPDLVSSRMAESQARVNETGLEKPIIADEVQAKSFLNRLRGISPEQEARENKEADPLYQQAKRDVPDDVEAEYLRLQSNQSIERRQAKESPNDFGAGQLGNAGISELLGNFENTGAGLLHYINKIPNVKLFGGEDSDPTMLQAAETALRRFGGIRAAEAEGYTERNPNQGQLADAVQHGLGLLGDLPYFAALPGNGLLAMGGKFAVAGTLKDVGRKGYADEETLKAAPGHFISGVLLEAGGALGKTARQGLLNAVLSKTAVEELAAGTMSLSAKANLALHLYERGVTIGSVSSAVAAQTLLEGGTPKQAFNAGVNMALLDVAFHAKKDVKMLTGGMFRATDGVTTKYVTVTPEGDIVTLKKRPPVVDGVLDISALVRSPEDVKASITRQIKAMGKTTSEEGPSMSAPERKIAPAPEGTLEATPTDPVRGEMIPAEGEGELIASPPAGPAEVKVPEPRRVGAEVLGDENTGKATVAREMKRPGGELIGEKADDLVGQRVTGRFRGKDIEGEVVDRADGLVRVRQDNGSEVLLKEGKVTPIETPKTLTHTNPKFDGKEIVGETADGRKIILNPETADGVSRVKDQSPTAQTPDAQAVPPTFAAWRRENKVPIRAKQADGPDFDVVVDPLDLRRHEATIDRIISTATSEQDAWDRLHHRYGWIMPERIAIGQYIKHRLAERGVGRENLEADGSVVKGQGKLPGGPLKGEVVDLEPAVKPGKPAAAPKKTYTSLDDFADEFDGALASVSTPQARQEHFAQRDRRISELVPDLEGKFTGKGMEINSAAAEFNRRMIEITTGQPQPVVDAQFVQRGQIQDVADKVGEFTSKYGDRMPPESVARLQKYQAQLKKASKAGKIIYTFDDAVGHEQLHKLSRIGAKASKALSQRVADIRGFVERNRAIIEKAHANHYGNYAGYELPEYGEAVTEEHARQTAVHVEEMAVSIMEGRGGDRLGLSPEERASFFDDWMESYEAQHGDGSAKNIRRFLASMEHGQSLLEKINEQTENIETSAAGGPKADDGNAKDVEHGPIAPEGGSGEGSGGDVQKARSGGPAGEKTAPGSSAPDVNNPKPGDVFHLRYSDIGKSVNVKVVRIDTEGKRPAIVWTNPIGDDPVREQRSAVDEIKGEYARHGVDEGGQSLKSVSADEDPQTKTDEFKNFFRDSKVVDEEGRPLAVYHGTDTPADFTVFRALPHFGDLPAAETRLDAKSGALDEDVADEDINTEHHRLIPAYLSIKNPLRIDDTRGEMHVWDIGQQLVKAGKISQEDARDASNAWNNHSSAKPFRDLIKSLGYDGFVYTNPLEGGESWIPLDSEQIKSAIGNSGAFDPNDPNILKSVSPADGIGLRKGPKRPRDEKGARVAEAIEAEFKRSNPKPYAEMSHDEVVNALVDSTRKEYRYQKKLDASDPGFYTGDIVKSNEKLRDWAKKKYDRDLTDDEIAFFHLVSAMASPGAPPVMDSAAGMRILRRYLETGEISPYSDKHVTVWEPDAAGTKKDTNQLRFDEQGDAKFTQEAPKYNRTGLARFQSLMNQFGGTPQEQIGAAMNWLTSNHSQKEVQQMFGLSKPPRSEYMTKEEGGKGIFGLTAAKLGSYLLNRIGFLDTATKDMWVARTINRHLGLPLTVKEGKNLVAIKKPPSETTREGIALRRQLDEAWKKVAAEEGVSVAEIQQTMWNFEKQLWEHLGYPASDKSYVSTGIEQGLKDIDREDAEGTRASGVFTVPNTTAGLKQLQKAFGSDAFKSMSDTATALAKALGVNLHENTEAASVGDGRAQASMVPEVSGPRKLVHGYAAAMASLAPEAGPVRVMHYTGGEGEPASELRLKFNTQANAAEFATNKANFGLGDITLDRANKSVIIVGATEAQYEQITKFYGSEVLTGIEQRNGRLETLAPGAYAGLIREARAFVQADSSARDRKQFDPLFDAAEARAKRLEAPDPGENLKSVSPLGFYSQVERTIEDKMPNRASADQVRGLFFGTAEKDVVNKFGETVLRKGDRLYDKGVSREELDWLDIDGFLRDNPKPTKQELLDYVRMNNADVREVVKGGKDQADYKPFEAGLITLLTDERLPQKTGGRMSASSALMSLRDSAQRDHDFGTALHLANIPPAELENFDGIRQGYIDYQKAFKSAESTSTKFETGMGAPLPGGDPGSYRELLITMPEAKDSGAWKITPQPNGKFALRKPDGTLHTDSNGNVATWSNRTAAEAAVRSNSRSEGVYKSSHWDEPNVLAHVRFDTRDGGKTLHIAEIQSDWHQAGRKQGYAGDATLPSTYKVEKEGDTWIVRDALGEPTGSSTKSEADALEKATQLFRERLTGKTLVPDAPFKKSWPLMAFKRVLRHAVENGYDRLTWDTGETNAERYDLSKQIDKITVTPRTNADTGEVTRSLFISMPDGHGLSVGVGKDGVIDNTGASNSDWMGKRLDDVIGKDLAEKIMATEGKAELAGLDLKVGGEGMRAFYDKILPTEIGKYVKKWGATVQPGRVTRGRSWNETFTPLNKTEAREALRRGEKVYGVRGNTATGNASGYAIKDEADLNNYRRFNIRGIDPVHEVKITDSMRDSVSEGQSLFSVSKDQRETPESDDKPVEAFLGKSVVRTPVYHGAESERTDFQTTVGKRYNGDKEQEATSPAFFFTPDADYAKEHGDVLTKAHIRLENPIDLTGGIEGISDKKLRDMAIKAWGDDAEDVEPGDMWQTLDSPKMVARMRELGHDGASLVETDGAGIEHDTYAVFDADQIRTRNTGSESTADSSLKSVSRTQEDTPEFKKFFDGSKVVDDEGKPKIVYTGSEDSDIEVFETGEDVGRSEPAVFFSDNPRTASYFASKNMLPQAHQFENADAFNKALQAEREYGEIEGFSAKPTVYPAYLSLKNPKYGTSEEIDTVDATNDIEQAKKEGYDGIIVTDVHEVDHEGATTYIVFYPHSQIKSAIGNNGQFSNDPSILKSVSRWGLQDEEPETPVPPVPEQRPAREKLTSIKNAIVDDERQARGLPPAMPVLKRTFGEAMDNAMAAIDRDPEVQNDLIRELRKSPRALTDTEGALLAHRQVELQNQFDRLADDLNKAADAGDTDAVNRARVKLAGVSDALLDLYNVGKRAGTESARGLNARKMMLREDFSLAALERKKRAANGGRRLTGAEFTELQKTAAAFKEKNDALEKLLADREKQLTEGTAQDAVDDIMAKASPRVIEAAEKIVANLNKRADAARERLKARGNIFTSGIDPLALKDLAEIGAAHIAEAGLDLAKWSERMIAEFGDKVKPHLTELWDASNKQFDSVTGSTKIRGAIKVKADKPADLKTKIAERLKNGTDADVSGLVGRLAQQFVKDGTRSRETLITQVHDVLKDIDPEITRRDTADAISGYGKYKPLAKDEVSVVLRDLKGQIQQVLKLEDMAAGEAPKKTGMERREPSDEERRLIKQVEEEKKKGGYAVTDPATQLRTVAAAVRRSLENQIKDLTHEITTGERIVRTKRPTPTSPEIEALRDQRDELRAQHLAKFGVPTRAPMSEQQKLKAALTNIQKQIDRLQGDIDSGTKTVVQKSARLTSPELEAARAERERLRALHTDIFGAPDRKLTDEQRLRAWKKRSADRMQELQDRLAAGDFSKKPRRGPVPLDPEAKVLKIELEKIKRSFDAALRRDQMANRTKTHKAMDFAAKWARMSFLSWPTTLVKLTSAAGQRILYSPLEEAVGVPWARTFSRAAALSPSEAGFDANAEAKAFTVGIREGMKHAYQMLTTGDNDLSRLYGTREHDPPATRADAIMEFWGTMHGALKATPKAMAFERSYAKRAAFAIKNGMDITDPEVEMGIGVAAYADANRAIFMQDNFLTKAYKNAIRDFQRPDPKTGRPTPANKTAATLMAIAFPVVKVPTNVVGEIVNYSTGLPHGLVKLRNAYKAGLDTLPPEQLDMIFRLLKKGSVGPALMLLGYYNPNVFGGYYQPRQKRDPLDAKVGSIKMFGYNVPSLLLHNPATEMMQVGSTIRRVADSKFRKDDEESRGIFAGIIAAAIGVGEEIPFVKESLNLAELADKRDVGSFVGDFAKGRTIPGAVQYLANKLDTTDNTWTGDTTRRNPEGFTQTMESGIPGLRKYVPSKEPDLNRISPDALEIQLDKVKPGPLMDRIAELKAAGKDTTAMEKALVEKLDEKTKIPAAEAERANQLLGRTGENAYVGVGTVKEKPDLSGKYNKSADGLLDRITGWAKALGTTPLDAFDKLLKDETFVRMENGTIIVKRMPKNASDAERKRLGGGGKAVKLDHTVPLELGGTNDQDNLRLVTDDEWSTYTPMENYLAGALHDGQITGPKAHKLIKAFKDKKLTQAQVLAEVGRPLEPSDLEPREEDEEDGED